MFLRLMSDLNPKTIIIDSGMMHSEKLYVEVFPETDDSNMNATADGSGKGTSLVGMVSQGLLTEMCERLGWNITYIPWEREDLESIEGCEDYFNKVEGKRCRFTCVLTR